MTVTSTHKRLMFRAKQIEPLEMTDTIRFETSNGNFELTKAEVYTLFSNVIESMSYQTVSRLYHYSTLPKKILPFKVE